MIFLALTTCGLGLETFPQRSKANEANDGEKKKWGCSVDAIGFYDEIPTPLGEV